MSDLTPAEADRLRVRLEKRLEATVVSHRLFLRRMEEILDRDPRPWPRITFAELVGRRRTRRS